MMRWRRTIACGLFHSPLQKELVCIIPPSFTVILCSDCPVYMPACVHEYPPAYVKYYTQEDTPGHRVSCGAVVGVATTTAGAGATGCSRICHL